MVYGMMQIDRKWIDRWSLVCLFWEGTSDARWGPRHVPFRCSRC